MSGRNSGNNGLQRSGGLQKITGQSDGIVDATVADVVNEFGKYVCQILQDLGGEIVAIGTGFLVGPNKVLTNFHVIEGVSFDKLSCRFDVKMNGPRNFKAGPLIPVEEVIETSPYGNIEANGYSRHAQTHPTLDELDFALLKIQTHPKNRDWLNLSPAEPQIDPDSKVYVLQHPKKRTLSVAEGNVTDHQPPNAARFRHLADTEEGSSGSPCFCWTAVDENGSNSLVLKALHNFGDPGTIFRDSEFNHGIPTHLIAQNLDAKGLLEKTEDRVMSPKVKWAAITTGLILLSFISFEGVEYSRYKNVVPEFGYNFSKLGSGWVTAIYITQGIEDTNSDFKHPKLKGLSNPVQIAELDISLYDVENKYLDVKPPFSGQDVIVTGYAGNSFFPKSYSGNIFLKDEDSKTWIVNLDENTGLSGSMAGGIVRDGKTKQKLGIMLYFSDPEDIDLDGSHEYSYSFVAFSDVYEYMNVSEERKKEDLIREANPSLIDPEKISSLFENQVVVEATGSNKLTQYIALNSDKVKRGETAIIKIKSYTSNVSALALIQENGITIRKVDARYDPRHGGVFIPIKIPEGSKFGILEIKVYVQSLNNSDEDVHNLRLIVEE